MKIEDLVRERIEKAVMDLGYEIVEIEFLKKDGNNNLTIYVDYPNGGITLDDCEKINGIVDPILDDLDPTNGRPYMLNVMSPGLDRPFKRQRDYERNYGKEVEVKLYAPLKGKKVYEGTLLSHDENALRISISGEEQTIENSRIALVRPLIKFE